MADGYPERILQRLLQEFQPASPSPSPDRAPSLEIRLKMGEVLMRASRAMGTITSELHLSFLAFLCFLVVTSSVCSFLLLLQEI